MTMLTWYNVHHLTLACYYANIWQSGCIKVHLWSQRGAQLWMNFYQSCLFAKFPFFRFQQLPVSGCTTVRVSSAEPNKELNTVFWLMMTFCWTFLLLLPPVVHFTCDPKDGGGSPELLQLIVQIYLTVVEIFLSEPECWSSPESSSQHDSSTWLFRLLKTKEPKRWSFTSEWIFRWEKPACNTCALLEFQY